MMDVRIGLDRRNRMREVCQRLSQVFNGAGTFEDIAPMAGWKQVPYVVVLWAHAFAVQFPFSVDP